MGGKGFKISCYCPFKKLKERKSIERPIFNTFSNTGNYVDVMQITDF